MLTCFLRFGEITGEINTDVFIVRKLLHCGQESSNPV